MVSDLSSWDGVITEILSKDYGDKFRGVVNDTDMADILQYTNAILSSMGSIISQSSAVSPPIMMDVPTHIKYTYVYKTPSTAVFNNRGFSIQSPTELLEYGKAEAVMKEMGFSDEEIRFDFHHNLANDTYMLILTGTKNVEV
jgi:hypothetical protein